MLSGDLREELAALAPPVEGVPTESEIRVAQAQLVGWLEGLFHGIQAAMFAQQAAARAQFEELRRRGFPVDTRSPAAARRPALAAASTSSRGLARLSSAGDGRGRLVSRRRRRACPPPASRWAMYTGMIDSSISTSATAFTTGCASGSRRLLKIQIGSVSVDPAVKFVTTISSNESPNASSPPATGPSGAPGT